MPSAPNTFNGKIIIVTGATRGIGKAIAQDLIAHGAQVVGTGTGVSVGQLCENQTDASIIWHPLDLSNQDSIRVFIEWLHSMGPIWGLVNNAGVNRIKPLQECSLDDFATVLDVNLLGPYQLCQSLGLQMAEEGDGRILNIASIWSVISKANRSMYSSAKSALAGMTRALATELGPRGVLLNTLSPGFVLTDLTRDSLSDEEMIQLASQVPLKRMAQPEEIARIARFLISPDNTYLHGQNVVADGGFTIQ